MWVKRKHPAVFDLNVTFGNVAFNEKWKCCNKLKCLATWHSVKNDAVGIELKKLATLHLMKNGNAVLS